MVASIVSEPGGKGRFRKPGRSRHRLVPVAALLCLAGIGHRTDGAALGMKHTWYVTFEVPLDGTLSRRRHPRLTNTFESEAAAKDFARTKFNDGLIVSAGTVIPHFPRVSIPSAEIPTWLEAPNQVDPDQ
ncbi:MULTISPECIES: hypothetical protein [Bradyrhizobium]|uniref:hypothetical protein n=1 Tax=Bradyrhizobium TaxID=374 RepID=UPI001F0AB5C1|nr:MULTISPECIES: hypothetical protein [Bradyrhizobium]WOH62850.1 hypothetical protein RX329_38375 [Bradyrhizobium sp. BWC-3-1]